MSELANGQQENLHRNLLLTVSTLALSACVFVGGEARAENAPVWIELGGGLAQQESDQGAFLPPFSVATPRPPFITTTPANAERSPPSSLDGTAKISFEPSGTDWVFSASGLFGKSDRSRSPRERTSQLSAGGVGYFAFRNITAKSSEKYIVLDFKAGKDVGLGMIGESSSSLISLGVRYAQFNLLSSSMIQSQPANFDAGYAHGYPYHLFYASFAASRKFTGVGPSLSWDGSAGLIGNPGSSQIVLDWGASAAILFGRQTVRGHYEATNIQVGTPDNRVARVPVYQNPVSLDRNRQVTVPDLGGFAGVSWRYPNAKVTLGYRADFFFGAMDGGIDAARRKNIGFYGPFASVSVGIGG